MSADPTINSLPVQEEGDHSHQNHTSSEVALLQAQIEKLKKDRIDLVNQVEAEEEYITNVLQKRLEQLQKEKVDLELALEQEQEYIVNKLQKQMDEMRQAGTGCVGPSECDNRAARNNVEVEALKLQMDRLRLKFSEREQDRTLLLVFFLFNIIFKNTHKLNQVQRQLLTVQSENHHLLQENMRLSQRLRRNSSSFSNDEQSLSPPRHQRDPHHSVPPCDHKSGSISDLRRQSFSDSEPHNGPGVSRSRTPTVCIVINNQLQY